MWKKTTMWYYYTPILKAEVIKHWLYQVLPKRGAHSCALLVEFSISTLTLESSLAILKKLNTHLPYDPSILFLGIFPREVKPYVHTKMCRWVFTAALLVIVKNCKILNVHQQING